MMQPREDIQGNKKIGRQKARGGFSLVELAGFFAALLGGLVLGSVYLGVDMKSTALEILERAEQIKPSHWGGQAAAEETPEKVDRALANEASSPFDRGNNPSESSHWVEQAEAAQKKVVHSSTAATEEEAAELPALTDDQKETTSREFWAALIQCMEKEMSSRSEAITDSRNLHLFDYLKHRKEGHQKAVDAIEQLTKHGVDARLLTYSQRVLAWHRAGVQLFGQAANLLTNAPTSKLTGPYSQSWQSAATQHRMEGNLLRERHGVVNSYITHKYQSLAPSLSNTP